YADDLPDQRAPVARPASSAVSCRHADGFVRDVGRRLRPSLALSPGGPRASSRQRGSPQSWFVATAASFAPAVRSPYWSELTLNPSLAAGVRWRDLLVSAGWNVTAFRLRDRDLSVRFWGGAFVSLRAVIDRRIDLAVRVEVLDGGAYVTGSAVV